MNLDYYKINRNMVSAYSHSVIGLGLPCWQVLIENYQAWEEYVDFSSINKKDLLFIKRNVSLEKYKEIQVKIIRAIL